MGEGEGNVFSGAEILIAEDSRTQAERLTHYLSNQGYAITVARDGKQALTEALRRTPAMIITDVVMPEMDGYTLCREIKALPSLKDVPVVLLTSLSRPQDIVKGLECGADSFIRKPYEDKYLLSRVEYILTNVELRKTDRLQVGVQLQFGGQSHFITAEKQQILDLLISTYEGAVQINEELEIKQQELQQAAETLEVRVAERTAELAQTNEQLQIQLLRTTLKEREVSLKEIHHRVKNNLQVISSLINLQLRRVSDQAAREALQEGQSRVQAISLIHEMLYQSSDYANVPFSEYARRLAANVFGVVGVSPGQIALDLAIDDVALLVDKAVPCGLILNELITNALKHGFPNGRRGTVRVALHRVGEEKLELSVGDDGVGMREGLDIRQTKSLGMRLVYTLAEQLSADLEIVREKGTCVKFTFLPGNAN